jgi:hypothetical protein
MPRVKRTKRVSLLVTDEAKALALRIAAAMTSDAATWSETDVWEQGVLYLARRADVKTAMEAATARTDAREEG